jgi:hypothetical protein
VIINLSNTETPGEVARTPFQVAFDSEACERLASVDAAVRGRAMAAGGLVGELRIRPHVATGTVAGTSPADTSFQVRLSVDDDGPDYSCTCGDGAAPVFCDHAVAVALVATGAIDPGDEDEHDDDTDEDLDDDIGDPHGLRPLLSGLAHDELVDLVLAIADTDDEIAKELLNTLTSDWRS